MAPLSRSPRDPGRAQAQASAWQASTSVAPITTMLYQMSSVSRHPGPPSPMISAKVRTPSELLRSIGAKDYR
jgi:hypothetical protein